MPDDQTTTLPLLVLCRDLLLSSKITGTAQAHGVPFKVVRDPARLAGAEGRQVMADLNQEGALEAAAAWAQATGKTVIGFVAHTDALAIRRAREAGIQQVLARSQFVAQLEKLI